MNYNTQYDETVSAGEWIGTFLLCAIPVVNIILMFVWAFGGSAKPSKRNFFRAQLLIAVIIIGLSVLVIVAGFALGLFSSGSLSGLLNY